MFTGAAALFGLLGNAVSGISSIINNRRSQQLADQAAARDEAELRARANENPLSRSEVQYALGALDRRAREATETARSVSAIKGSTPELALAVQKQQADARANAMGQIAAGASARADRYNLMADRVRRQKVADDQQRMLARNQTYAALAANATNAVGAIMDSYGAGAKPEQAPTQQPAAKAPDAAGNQRQLQQPTASSSPIPHQNPVSVSPGEANAGYTANADGTYTKDGQIYVKGFDNVFRLRQ